LGTTAQLLYVAGLAIFVMMGGHHVMLSLLVASFETFPLAGVGTGAVSLDIGFVVNLVLGLLEVVFDMALRIAAPMLCIVFLESVAMGFISRTVPQLNIMSVGFVVRILAGLALLVVSIEASLNVFRRTLMPVLEELAQMFGAG
ncbi:MAG: flagellar biosynthetic protein FliR, partial [Algisphaera sp.]